MEAKDLITIIGIGLTFVTSLAGLIYSVRTSRKNKFIDSITISRTKWIDELRDEISKFCGLITHLRATEKIGKKVERELFEEIDVLGYRINLMLNRHAKHDRLIIDRINNILEHLDADDAVADEEIKKLIHLTQDLFKFEWERIKEESVKGALSNKDLTKLQIKSEPDLVETTLN